MPATSLPRRTLGPLLREYRIRAKKGQLSASLHIEISPQGISRLEDGHKIKIATSQLKDLLDLYQVTEGERELVLGLWDEIKRQEQIAKRSGTAKGWWRAYEDQLLPNFDYYLSLESATDHMTTHQLVLVPGLLQTPDYRRALIKGYEPDLSAVDVERRLELATRRQAKLQDESFRLDVLISEAVLRHEAGGPAVMAAQLRRLVEPADRATVSVRVVPFQTGAHPGLVVLSFSLLEFPPLTSRLVQPPVIYTEGAEGGLYLEREDVIGRYRRAIGGIEAVALNEEDTRDLVLAIAKEYAA
ncbi:helix-turn-helix domain-containing protein [Nocardia inohanensis]|uniref:helix-turn-helix domain-containing protein n=1 Tax=Nocardia inohanensis TaxID=209246 RepID=UPI000831632D|nr:helix-turn-helix transcriptional regulator [Nocardia inohanensis]